MSEDIYSRVNYAGLDDDDVLKLQPVVQRNFPDYTGGLYAPAPSYNPGQSPILGVNPDAYKMKNGKESKTAATDLSAAVIRAQYADYEKRFQPLEDIAINSITPTGTTDLPYDLARTGKTVNDTFSNLQGQQNRSRERFGLQATGPKIAGSNDQTSAMVGGLNTARFADQDRRLKMLGGGVSSVAESVRG